MERQGLCQESTNGARNQARGPSERAKVYGHISKDCKNNKMAELEFTPRQQTAEVMLWKTGLLTQLVKLKSASTMWKSMKDNIIALVDRRQRCFNN